MATSPLPASHGQPGHPILGFVACAAVVRRVAFLAAGGFSERLVIGGEEELLSWDLAAAAWELSYVPEIAAHHDPPPAPGGRPHRREATLRNALWTTWLRRPLPPALGATAHAIAQAGADRVAARALFRAIAGGIWVLRERSVSPPHVEAMRRRLE
jgi:GT2 family glycosyltransferase